MLQNLQFFENGGAMYVLYPIYLKQNHSHFRTGYRPTRSTGFGNDSWQSEGRQPAVLSKPKNAATKSRQLICRIDASGQEKKNVYNLKKNIVFFVFFKSASQKN